MAKHQGSEHRSPPHSAVMQLLPWLQKIVPPLNVNHWTKIISRWSSVAPRVKWRAGLSSGVWLHLKVWKITAHKHSLRQNFPLGKLDICYAIALKGFFEDLTERVALAGRSITRRDVEIHSSAVDEETRGRCVSFSRGCCCSQYMLTNIAVVNFMWKSQDSGYG